jgi:hypothetical protein
VTDKVGNGWRERLQCRVERNQRYAHVLALQPSLDHCRLDSRFERNRPGDRSRPAAIKAASAALMAAMSRSDVPWSAKGT